MTLALEKAAAAPTAKASVGRSALGEGRGASELEKTVRRIAAARNWDVAEPLPTTREIGGRFGISNATVCRLLMRLSDEGVIWRRDNGRYYLNDSRRILELHKPYACLLRKLQSWSRVYQSIMGGFSQAFGRDPASMLFVHNETLVRHIDPAHPPVHANAAEQRQALADFFRVNPGEFRGILLDEVWDDRVLAEFAGQLSNAVVVCRRSALPDVSSVAPDFQAGALLVVGHLYARGFDEIWLAVPYDNSAVIDSLREAVARATAMLGCGMAPENICPAATPAAREQLIARLRASRKRIGLFCLEDNMALILHRALTAAGIECPAKVGLLSGMGTDLVTERHISSLQIDYDAIGRAAGEIMMSGRTQHSTLQPTLAPGTTT